MTTIRSRIFRCRGFTLVELAIVLVIVALILGSGLTLISAQQEQRRIEDTKARLSNIQEALIGFVIVNGRLPCPADVTTPAGQTNAANVPAGSEYKNPVTGTPYVCFNASGVLPWATLGVSETDAWGRRFTYQVTNNWADSTDGTGVGTCSVTVGVSFQLCSSANLSILTAPTALGGVSLAANIPAVVVSHGVNGLGAYLPSGQQILPVPAATTNEGENANNDSNFVSRTLSSENETGGYFDDQVIWLSPNILFNRMVQAGKLP